MSWPGAGRPCSWPVRNEEKGRQAIARITDEIPEADVQQRALDLADLDSVRAFAAAVPTVHGLVNNAGVVMPPRTLTKQGFELQAHLADPPEHADPVWTIRWLASRRSVYLCRAGLRGACSVWWRCVSCSGVVGG